MSGNQPAVSVLVVSDYGGRTAEDWGYLRETLATLSRQAFEEEVEVLLLDATPAGQQMPSDLLGIVPGLRVISSSGASSRELLNTAVRAATADLVVLLDGDCAPAPGWLRAAVDTMCAHPEVAAVSGRTTYPDKGFTCRVLATLSRSFVDPGGPGPTRFISNNNAIFRRDVLLAHPLPGLPRPLAARLQTEAIRLAGGALYFEPRMRVTHRFEGWPMERRIRRHVGYRAVRVRQLDPRVPHAWMLRFGMFAIPLMLAARTLDSWWDCVRAGRHYGLRWFELPAAFATAVAVHLLEIGGMVAAFAEARAGSAQP
ncbi:MAG TPA: glycosyltransferase family 2 protein [Candidatus Margulisiibacteriota bacterium]|nr:glycosyltransferase family 2 protein [Candidatus Margulisiibacteriota bacterium]